MRTMIPLIANLDANKEQDKFDKKSEITNYPIPYFDDDLL